MTLSLIILTKLEEPLYAIIIVSVLSILFLRYVIIDVFVSKEERLEYYYRELLNKLHRRYEMNDNHLFLCNLSTYYPKSFRQDLKNRLCEIDIKYPDLRERISRELNPSKDFDKRRVFAVWHGAEYESRVKFIQHCISEISQQQK